ncbi:MAG: hypothetical protein ACK55I_36920 [bacterium]
MDDGPGRSLRAAQRRPGRGSSGQAPADPVRSAMTSLGDCSGWQAGRHKVAG